MDKIPIDPCRSLAMTLYVGYRAQSVKGRKCGRAEVTGYRPTLT
jgi:hypothetical protein